MHDTAAVRVRKRVPDVLQHAHDLARWQRAHASHALGQRFAFHEAHCIGEECIAFLHRVHRYAIGVGKARRRARLTEKALTECHLRCKLGGQYLERDEPVEAQVAREIHGSHPAPTELPLDSVAIAKRAVNGIERGARNGRDGHSPNMRQWRHREKDARLSCDRSRAGNERS